MSESPPPFRLVPSDEYAAKKATLNKARLRQVETAERGIAEDPDHYEDRWPADDGGRIDYSASDSGSMIKYRRDERPGHESEVELTDLLDIAHAAGVRRWPKDSD